MFKWLSNLFKPQEVFVNGYDIAKLNRDINKQVRYTKDLTDGLVTGRDIREGDCEDIAGCKYLHLKDRGIESSPCLVKLKDGTWHCVLVTGTNVLDNRTNKVYNYWKMKQEMSYTIYNPKVPAELIAQRKYEYLFEQLK